MGTGRGHLLYNQGSHYHRGRILWAKGRGLWTSRHPAPNACSAGGRGEPPNSSSGVATRYSLRFSKVCPEKHTRLWLPRAQEIFVVNQQTFLEHPAWAHCCL